MTLRFPSLLAASGLLAGYYGLLAFNMERAGLHTAEALFLAEKALIVWEGAGDIVPVLGLTFPIFPFFCSLLLNGLLPQAGSVIASCLGTSLLFYLILSDQRQRAMPELISVGTCLLFLLHPGLLFAATSGQSLYLVLLFGYLFFRSLLTYYQSNTTYHVSMASLFLVGLVFSSFDFIWLTIFLLPLVLFIALQGLSLRGEDSILRLGLAVNNLSLRRKLVNKSFALIVLLFLLPMGGLLLFSLLNEVYAGDMQYFLDSPYANWRVLYNHTLRLPADTSLTHPLATEMSLLISLRRLLYAPLLLLSLANARSRSYQLLTLLSPLALVEFLHLKDPLVPAQAEFYQIFLVLAWAGLVLMPAAQLRRLRYVAFGLMLLQIVTSSIRLMYSPDEDERQFVPYVTAWQRNDVPPPPADDALVQFIRQLPDSSRILADDATAYPIIARTGRVRQFVLAYQNNYLAALNQPASFVQYVLIHSAQNDPLARFATTNGAYLAQLQQQTGQALTLRIRQGDWALYEFRRNAPRLSDVAPADRQTASVF